VPLRAALCLLAVAACSRASEESEARRSPKPIPPPRVEIPEGLAIPVTVDGAAAEPITRARLDGLVPDFADDERRAWKLTAVVPAYDRPGAFVEARGPTGISIRVPRPDGEAAPQPVLFFTRRGDVVVSMVDPDDPFPGYHGRGGQLRRQGDPLPRLSPVAEIIVETR
jgi:hypothetical protein